MRQVAGCDRLSAQRTTVEQYLDDLSSNAPIPGGGGAAAISGSLGAALLSMVCRLTLGRDRYRESWMHMEPLLEESEQLRKFLLKAADDDADAYNAVANAMRLPRASSADRRERRAVLQTALRRATAVPLETARAVRRILDLTAVVAKYGNPNLVSDAGVAAALAEAALQSAALNVRINTASIRDSDFVATIKAELNELLNGAKKDRSAVLAKVNGVIDG